MNIRLHEFGRYHRMLVSNWHSRGTEVCSHRNGHGSAARQPRWWAMRLAMILITVPSSLTTPTTLNHYLLRTARQESYLYAAVDSMTCVLVLHWAVLSLTLFIVIL